MFDTNEQLDNYINDLAGIEPDNTPDVNEQEPSADTSRSDGSSDFFLGAKQQTTESNVGEQSPTKPNVSGQNTPAQKQPQQQTEQEDIRNLRPLGDGVYQNRKGDIVDDRGRVIAQGGFAARMFHTNKRLKAQLEEQQQQLSGLGEHVRAIQGFAQTIGQSGLNNQEVQWALDAASRIKKGDDLGVAKEILALIASKGYNVTDLLGAEVGDSIELKAINHMIDRRLAPITQEQQARQQQTEIEQRARQQYNAFVRENEFAEVHANEIARLAQQDGVSPQNAYNRIREFALVNGFDFSRPIGPQVAARQQSAQPQRPMQQNAQPQQRTQRPLPNGGVTRSGVHAPAATSLASADDDWGSIIREVQRTVGH